MSFLLCAYCNGGTDMKKRNKAMKFITITMAGAVFGIGVAVAFKTAGIDNIFEQVATQSMLSPKSTYT